MSMCADCIKVVTHEGVPTGSQASINGVDCYIAEPSEEYAKEKVVLFLTDGFGIGFINNQLLVDDYAKNGYKTIAMDLFNGDVFTEENIKTIDLPAWVSRHGRDFTRPIIDKVVDGLKQDGVNQFAATGYCFGGRYVFDLGFDNVISTSIATHPSMLECPSDFEAYVSKSSSPLLLNTGGLDVYFPPKIYGTIDTIFDGFAPGYKRTLYEGCAHGFAVRGDIRDPKVKQAKESAFEESIKWLRKHF
ncbi:alpha beta-hydrolase [Cylindrobasidium torrendii FP15055 ss-10]|uniref:Alpha beta-hydrolase n=1 Tax=Cylindrobasidium torrendii FP15055 ss-10 TaxID=1314674 RepID=A0A0D7B6U1_9AGAR|nr:alpha beta-hydrolase [Cylindrobasidium torrendii FP15055 ss-10]